MRRIVLAAAAAVGLASVAVLGVAGPASAHDTLVASTPAAGSTLTAVPETFSVTMNEGVLDIDGTGDGFALQIRAASGRYYGTGCLTIRDDTVSTPAELGAAGEYQLLWQVVSADGHPVSGAIDFHYAPSVEPTVTTGSATPPGCGKTNTPGVPVAGPPQTVPLNDVLWIGGAVLAVGIAIGITLLVVSRPRRKRSDETAGTS